MNSFTVKYGAIEDSHTVLRGFSAMLVEEVLLREIFGTWGIFAKKGVKKYQ